MRRAQRRSAPGAAASPVEPASPAGSGFYASVNEGIHRVDGEGGDDIARGAGSLVARAAEGGGDALPGGLRSQFEQSLGTGLGEVRVHTDGAAAAAASALGARAFAHGQRIFMGAGAYAPDSPAGASLLAHEVAHTVQQRGGAAGPQCKLAVDAPGSAAEQEADRAAGAMLEGRSFTVTQGAPRGISRQRPGESANAGDHRTAEPTSVITSSDVAAPESAQERHAGGQGGGPDLANGLRELGSHTHAQVLEAVASLQNTSNASDPGWRGAAARPANGSATLRSLAQEIWYLAGQMYIVDRTGHIVPGDFRHELRVASLSPGTYFWGEFRGTSAVASRSLRRMFRVDGGVRLVSGDIEARSAMGSIALIERARGAATLHHGIAIIVSPHVATERRQHGFDGGRLLRVLRTVPSQVPWAVRSGVANLLDNPGAAVISQLQNMVMSRAAHWIGAAATPAGITMALHAGAELGTNLSIGSGRHSTDDEIQISAQAVARQLVSFVAGQLVDRGLARAGAALGRRGGNAPAAGGDHPARPAGEPPGGARPAGERPGGDHAQPAARPAGETATPAGGAAPASAHAEPVATAGARPPQPPTQHRVSDPRLMGRPANDDATLGREPHAQPMQQAAGAEHGVGTSVPTEHGGDGRPVAGQWREPREPRQRANPRPRDTRPDPAVLQEGEGRVRRANENHMAPPGTGTAHDQLRPWAARELEGHVPDPENAARDFGRWVAEGHRQSESGGAHQHMAPGSPRAWRQLNRWLRFTERPEIPRAPGTGRADDVFDDD